LIARPVTIAPVIAINGRVKRSIGPVIQIIIVSVTVRRHQRGRK
jgi:hypothetical protein